MSRVRRLQDYAEFVGPEELREIWSLVRHVEGATMVHVNSTRMGGGVAEILEAMIPLLNSLGVSARWEVIEPLPGFFSFTKALHNGLQGAPFVLRQEQVDTYARCQQLNASRLDLNADCVIIHDPQPAGLIRHRAEGRSRWVWRCHIDLSAPDPVAWGFLRPYVEQYDASIFSIPAFAQQLPHNQFMIEPSIDPLNDKNRDLDVRTVQDVLERYGIDPERPIITQVSRFDAMKDPVGVIRAFREVRRREDCQLVLAGGGASDDPEGQQVLAQVREEASHDPDIHVLELPPESDLEINALQRASTIIVQKSLREGFGLTVTEALWKGKPVVAGAVGGIRRQVIHGFTGFLVRSVEGLAYRLRQLLHDPSLRQALGSNGREHVRNNYLITRHLKDYLLLFLAVRYPDADITDLAGPGHP